MSRDYAIGYYHMDIEEFAKQGERTMRRKIEDVIRATLSIMKARLDHTENLKQPSPLTARQQERSKYARQR